jgi:hypothetical protein
VKIITLLTDFGLKDAYVGIMKGVIASINPDATVIDITHEIESQDITEAAFMIGDYFRWFEEGSIHAAIVDPTVGSARRPIILVSEGRYFVGPDNGIFTLVMGEAPEVYVVENQAFMHLPVSATFHGRDIFSPAAAHLSRGIMPREFGPALHDPVTLPGLLPEMEENLIRGKIVRFDRFGNGITNISGERIKPFLAAPFVIETGGMEFHALSRSYYEQEVTCLIGSSGYLEFGVFKGSFQAFAAAVKGQEVRIRAT